jgi:hypothetical protein
MCAGKLVPNPDVQEQQIVVAMDDDGCTDADGTSIQCCSWQPDPWTIPAIFLTAICVSWTCAIFAQIRTYVIAGTITQWCGDLY